MTEGAPVAEPRRPRVLSQLALSLDARLLAMVSLVGVLSGVLASAYDAVLRRFLRGSALAGHHVPTWALMPAAGLLIGLCYRLGEPGETDAVVDNIHLRNGRIDTRANLPLVPISLLSIAAGGSAGPEAPMVYLTGSVGTWLHRWLKLPEKEVRTLTLAGMGVGFAALFGAPIGSALFALEIPHKRGIEFFEATIPAMLGCLVGYGTFVAITGHGFGATWVFPAYRFHRALDLPLAAAVGLACGLATRPYAWCIRAVKRGVERLAAPIAVKAALGGALLGLVAWKLPATRFWGETQLQHFVVEGSPAIWLLLTYAAAKMLTVAVTLAAGWRGGIIIPSFFIGACIGKAIALAVPGVDPTLAMLAGMAAVNVSIMKVPLGTIFVLAAMSGVDAVAPLAVASFAAFVVSGGIEFLESKRDRADLAEPTASPRS